MQSDEGLVQAKRILKHHSEQDIAVFVAESEYIDRAAPAGSQVVLNEKLKVQVEKPIGFPAHGYFLNLSITNRCATEAPVEIVKYRYSGFSFRATESWDKNNSTVLTSEGKDRYTSNFSRAKWVSVQGDVPGGGKAGIVLMSHPGNRDHPQLLRTWGKLHNGSVFINFNPVQESPWKFEPDNDYIQRYRLFVYDGTVTAQQAEELWQDFAHTSKTRK